MVLRLGGTYQARLRRFGRTDISFSCIALFSILDKVTIRVVGEGFIDHGYHPFTQFIWNYLTNLGLVLEPLLLLV